MTPNRKLRYTNVIYQEVMKAIQVLTNRDPKVIVTLSNIAQYVGTQIDSEKYGTDFKKIIRDAVYKLRDMGLVGNIGHNQYCCADCFAVGKIKPSKKAKRSENENRAEDSVEEVELPLWLQHCVGEVQKNYIDLVGEEDENGKSTSPQDSDSSDLVEMPSGSKINMKNILIEEKDGSGKSFLSKDSDSSDMAEMPSGSKIDMKMILEEDTESVASLVIKNEKAKTSPTVNTPRRNSVPEIKIALDANWKQYNSEEISKSKLPEEEEK